MDHVIYLDAKAKEMENLFSGQKTMIIRGVTKRKMPYGRLNSGDVLYFINNDAEGVVKAKALTKQIINLERMSKEESLALVDGHQDQLRLTDKQFKRWARKRFIVLIEVEDGKPLELFSIDKSDYGYMDDWLPVESIEGVRR